MPLPSKFGIAGVAARIEANTPTALLVGIVAASAYGLQEIAVLSWLSPMISAIFVGILFANTVAIPDETAARISIAGKRILRAAVALLGVQLTFSQLAEVGVQGVGAAAFALLMTFFFILWLGRAMKVDEKLNKLIATGTSICGASAVAATNAVISAKDTDVSYAVTCVTLFGTCSMLSFPFIAHLVGLAPGTYGIWIGLSVQEVAQVVGAGFQYGEEAGRIAVVTKLARVAMLAPMILGLAVFASRGASGRPSPRKLEAVPLFIVAFLILAGLNSAALIPEAVRLPIISVTPVLLTAALAALGLGTSFRALRERGLRPLLLAGMGSAFIAILSILIAEFLI